MIDYVKILLKDIDTNRLCNIPELDFKIEVSEKTGEISTTKTAKYHFCKITVFDNGIVLFSGSIHKLYNSIKNTKAPNYKEQKIYKGYNGNLFTINNILKVKKHLETLFNCDAKQMIFQNIEFGINTNPNFNPQLFIKGLLYHNGRKFEYKYNEHYAQVVHQRYYIKIYNKSNQYQLQEHTLRVELKITKTQEIKYLGINTFEDINTTTLNLAKDLILKRFSEVIYYDYTISKKRLTNLNKQSLVKYSNPRYWLYTLKPQHRDRHKKKLAEFISKYSENLHAKIMQEIIKKCVIINRLSKTPSCVIINRSNIGLKITHNTSLKNSKKIVI